jgi:hypothetical protein
VGSTLSVHLELAASRFVDVVVVGVIPPAPPRPSVACGDRVAEVSGLLMELVGVVCSRPGVLWLLNFDDAPYDP